MKKLKFLLMLLMTIFLFESASLKSYAAITDIKETPDEYSLTESESFYDDLDNLQKVEISKEDEGKMQKIVIPEYSYFEINSSEDISLYKDSEKKNKITESSAFCLYLPKGEYFLCIEKYNGNSEENILLYGRVSVNTIIKDSVIKKDKYYDISNNGWSGVYHVEAFMVKDTKHFYYGNTYSITSGGCGENLDKKYSQITYDICVNSKDSKVKATPTGTTKKVINAEKTGEDSEKKDKKKPTVKGVKNGKTYKKIVKIKVSDASGIKKVTLNGKKMKVSKFKKGYKIKKNGKYTLKVWDKANNKRTVKFRIKK